MSILALLDIGCRNVPTIYNLVQLWKSQDSENFVGRGAWLCRKRELGIHGNQLLTSFSQKNPLWDATRSNGICSALQERTESRVCQGDSQGEDPNLKNLKIWGVNQWAVSCSSHHISFLFPSTLEPTQTSSKKKKEKTVNRLKEHSCEDIRHPSIAFLLWPLHPELDIAHSYRYNTFAYLCVYAVYTYKSIWPHRHTHILCWMCFLTPSLFV